MAANDTTEKWKGSPPARPAPQTNGALPPCRTCRWFVAAHYDAAKDKHPRCHLNPPVPQAVYHDKATWPVVPEQGGGCGQWEEKR